MATETMEQRTWRIAIEVFGKDEIGAQTFEEAQKDEIFQQIVKMVQAAFDEGVASAQL